MVCGRVKVIYGSIPLLSQIVLFQTSRTLKQEIGVPTVVERLQFVRCDFRIVHALEEWMDPGIVLTPEVIRNCDVLN